MGELFPVLFVVADEGLVVEAVDLGGHGLHVEGDVEEGGEVGEG